MYKPFRFSPLQKQWKELRSKKLQYPPSAALVGAAKQRAESNKDA